MLITNFNFKISYGKNRILRFTLVSQFQCFSKNVGFPKGQNLSNSGTFQDILLLLAKGYSELTCEMRSIFRNQEGLLYLHVPCENQSTEFISIHWYQIRRIFNNKY